MKEEVQEAAGLTMEQVAAYEARVAARQEANGKALPGPLLDAWTAEPVKAAGLMLQPVVAYHITMLQRIDSPIWKLATTPKEKRKSITVSHDDIYEAVFVFTRPIAEVRQALSKGRAGFREAALQATADRLPPLLMQELEAAVMENLTRGFSTWVGYTARSPEDGSVFTEPPAEPTTGSAGG